MGGIIPHDRHTQRGAELLEQRHPFEQLLHERRLSAEDFLHQVATHRAVRGVAQPFQERRRVRGAAQRERGQSQHRNPAIRPFFERYGGLVCHLLAQHAREKGFRLPQRKAQVGSAQFVQMPPSAPVGKQQWWIGSADEHQVQLERQMLDEQVEQGMHLARVNEVIVIEHQDDIVRHISELIDEQGGQAIGWWEVRCFEQAGGGPERIGKDGSQGSGKCVHEEAQLIVVFVKGEPGGVAVTRLQPLDQQSGLAKPGRRGNQRDLAAEPGVQALEETGTGDQIAAAAWSIEFGLEQGQGRVDSDGHVG